MAKFVGTLRLVKAVDSPGVVDCVPVLHSYYAIHQKRWVVKLSLEETDSVRFGDQQDTNRHVHPHISVKKLGKLGLAVIDYMLWV